VKKPKQKKLTSEIEKLIQRVEGIDDEDPPEGEKEVNDQQKNTNNGNGDN
jgi:hypothetical protein